ncbi:MAG TPA: hypothetical protein VFT22_23840 [Kofleriaceae bacterium]|nr:hypothetical protein [Kofleriaceae bacterium]
MAHRTLVVLAVTAVACGGRAQVAARQDRPASAPTAPLDKILAMLPAGAQVVIEIDLARLRANPVIGEVVTRALAERTEDLPAGVPASPLAAADQVVLAAYGVGTAQAATLTVLAAPREIPGTARVADGFYAVGPPDWVEQVQARVALATTGESRFAISAAPELLELRDHAMPPNAPGASLRVTARLSFDARVALARQTGLDAAPARLSAWADVADDLGLIVDCDAEDPGSRGRDAGGAAGKAGAPEASRRLAATLRGALEAVADQPAVRALGLPSSLAGARLIARGSWVRTIILVGPAHLRRVVERAARMLNEAAPASGPSPARHEPPASPATRAAPPAPGAPPAAPAGVSPP